MGARCEAGFLSLLYVNEQDAQVASWERHGLKPWLEAAGKRLHRNVLAIALANKLARIAWSVLARERAFEVRRIDQATVQPA
jgi:transposase